MYVIEHLEQKVWKWCLIEYKHISQIVGKENLWFTKVKRKNRELEKYGKVSKQSVKELDLKKACLLDPDAHLTLSPEEAKKFDYFIFGGILGDYPPKKRTKQLLTRFLTAEPRNIGKKQMSTDNAVMVVKLIREGTPLEKIPFQDHIEVETGKNESVQFPFRYVLCEGKPLVSKELVDYLKKKKGL